jgi:hypothetical protein
MKYPDQLIKVEQDTNLEHEETAGPEHKEIDEEVVFVSVE